MYEKKEMRTAMMEALRERFKVDPKLVTLDADLARANSTLPLHSEFPDRALEVGIAEANMACMAAGLASYGLRPFIFSFAPFATRRMADMVAVSIGYANQNVKIVGTDPGITAELNGATHMSVEDISVVRAIPNMVIFEPADPAQLEKAMPAIFEYEGPMYIRFLRKVSPGILFDRDDYQFDLFKADLLKEGKDVTLFATGIEVKYAMDAAAELAEEGISAEVINVHTIKPVDAETIVASVSKTGCAVTCENHNVIGGMGSAVTECLARNKPVPVEYIGIQDRFGEVGKLPYLIEEFKMSSKYIVEAAKKVIGRK